MAGQPITAAPQVELTFGLGTAVGVGVFLQEGGDPLDPDRRWRASQGFSIEGPPCSMFFGVDDICLPTEFDESSIPPLVAYADGFPFVISAAARCSTFGAPLDIGPWHAAVDRQLQLTQWTQIALELATGVRNLTTGHPAKHLSQTGSEVLGTGPVSPTEAISLLEAGFSALNAVGMIGGPRLIHVPPQALAYLKGENLLAQQGNRWYTPTGCLIVTDDGYVGMRGPGDAPPDVGKVWMYGTGPITARVDSQIFHPEPEMVDATRVRSNDIIVRAQKLVAATWLCGHLAVQMNLSDADV